jgi:hypothetical protein
MLRFAHPTNARLAPAPNYLTRTIAVTPTSTIIPGHADCIENIKT